MHYLTLSFHAPSFEKIGSILVSACPFVRACVRPFKKKIQARVLKFHTATINSATLLNLTSCN